MTAAGSGKQRLSNFGSCTFLIRRKNRSKIPYCLRDFNEVSIRKFLVNFTTSIKKNKSQNELISLPLEQNSQAQEEKRFKMR